MRRYPRARQSGHYQGVAKWVLHEPDDGPGVSEPMGPLLDVHMYPDVPVFAAIVDPVPDADDLNGGMTAVNLDDFGVPIPDDYRSRFAEWYGRLQEAHR